MSKQYLWLREREDVVFCYALVKWQVEKIDLFLMQCNEEWWFVKSHSSSHTLTMH